MPKMIRDQINRRLICDWKTGPNNLSKAQMWKKLDNTKNIKNDDKNVDNIMHIQHATDHVGDKGYELQM